MIVRLAVFQGHVPEIRHSEFKAHVTGKMLPLISAFPGISSVRVLGTSGGDGILANACLALEMCYPDRATMELALASPERAKNAAETDVLLEMIENPGVSHAVFDVIGQG